MPASCASASSSITSSSVYDSFAIQFTQLTIQRFDLRKPILMKRVPFSRRQRNMLTRLQESDLARVSDANESVAHILEMKQLTIVAWVHRHGALHALLRTVRVVNFCHLIHGAVQQL